MAATAEQTAAGDVTSIVSGLEQTIDRFVSGVEARIQGLATFRRKSRRYTLHSPRAKPALEHWPCGSP